MDKLNELYIKVKEMAISEKTIGEIFKEMTEQGHSREEITEALDEFNRKHIANFGTRIVD